MMLRHVLAGAIALGLSAAAAHAKPRTAYHPDCNVTMPCIGAPPPSYLRSSQPQSRAKKRAPRAVAFVGLRPANQPISLAIGVNSTLAAKVASIQSACPGTRVVSGLRHTKVFGTNRMSLHASGDAVDVRGPYGCIYSQLRGWPGGYSTDAGRVDHVHISYSSTGREMGVRFAHRGGWKKKHRHRRR